MMAQMQWKVLNVRLTREQWTALKIRSARDEKSLGQLIRDAVDVLLGRLPAPCAEGVVREEGPMYGLVGLVESGIEDGSDEHDAYLYGPAAGAPARRKNKKGKR